MHAIYWLTAQPAADGPLLLSVDDAHWSDASSLRAIDYLGRRVPDLPVMLVARLRPTEPEAAQELLDAIRFGDDAARLTVRALGVESVARIVREGIPDAEDEVCQACHAATRGNALYLQELLRAVLADGTEIDREKVTRAAVPSLGDRVLRRAARVSGHAPALARAMAVLGDGARLATAASLAGIGNEPAGKIAHDLRRLEVLDSEDPFTFVHPLVRRSVYDSMPEGERQAAHAGAARLLEQDGAPPEAVAAHLRMLVPSASSAIAQEALSFSTRAREGGLLLAERGGGA
jgi:predicted ATPase